MLEQLKMMPYNQKGETALKAVDVSSDRVSDLPLKGWEIPESLTKPHVFKLARMWVDWAR